MPKIGWVDVERDVETRYATLPREMTLDGPGHAIMLTGGDWKQAMINPPIPAGEVEYDLVDINAAVQAGEDLTWERVGPNTCRIVRAKPQESDGPA